MAKAKQKLSAMEVAGFCEQLAVVLKAGIYLSEGLEMMTQDNEKPEERAALIELRQHMEQTGTLAPALEAVGVFPEYMVHMVQLGEETGRLEEVLAALAGHYSREQEIRDSVRTAVTYPGLMLGMVVVIVAVLLTQVMPIFQQVFAQLGAELTGFSRVLMELGQSLRSGVVLAVAAAVLVAVAAWVLIRGRKNPAAAMRHVPGLKRLCDDLALCRFAGGMALALRSGLNPEHALELACQLNEDPVYGQRLAQACQKVEQGEDLTEVLTRQGILTGIYGRMASIGRKTGTLDETMIHIAQNAQDQVDAAIARILGRIEPALVVVLSLLVGGVLMSVMFPLLGILSGM